MARFVVGLVAAVPAFSLVLGIAILAGASAPPASASSAADVCVTRGPIHGLDAVQATNARIVTAVAERMSGSDAAVIAVMTGYTESRLRILGNAEVDTGPSPVQGEGSDHDSLGIFQQRGGWGSSVQRLDPDQSTVLFVHSLTSDAGWHSEAPWVAAQQVQHSAYDGHPRPANHGSAVVGGNYRVNLAFAEKVVSTIDGDENRQRCGAMTGGLPASSAPGSHGLPTSYTIPATATPAEVRVVSFAIAQLDKPYVYDAAGPAAYDCSGLSMAAWARGGVDLPHDAAAQSHFGISTSPDALVPGDLVFVPGDDGTLAAPGHVGIYIGDGLVLNAADEQIGIRVQTYHDFLSVGHGLSVLRHLG